MGMGMRWIRKWEGGEEGGGEADEDRNVIKVGKEVGRG